MKLTKGIAHLLTAVAAAMPFSLHSASPSDAIPQESHLIDGYSYEAAQRLYDSRPAQPVEGIWYFTDDKMTVAIERGDARHDFFNLVLVGCDDFELLPGTIIGYVKQCANSKEFDLWLYCEQQEGVLSNPKKCLATLTDDGAFIKVERPKIDVRVRINFARFLPTFFKGVSVIPHLDQASPQSGMKRIYPTTDSNDSHATRYL